MKRFLGKRIMINERSIPYSGEVISVGTTNIVLRCDSDMYGIQDLKFRRDEISVVCVELGYDLNKKWYVCRGDKVLCCAPWRQGIRSNDYRRGMGFSPQEKVSRIH